MIDVQTIVKKVQTKYNQVIIKKVKVGCQVYRGDTSVTHFVLWCFDLYFVSRSRVVIFVKPDTTSPSNSRSGTELVGKGRIYATRFQTLVFTWKYGALVRAKYFESILYYIQYIAMSGLLVSLIGPCRLVWVSRTEWCVSFGRIGTKFLSLDPLKSNPYCTKNKVLGSINPATVKSVNWYCTECNVWKSLVK